MTLADTFIMADSKPTSRCEVVFDSGQTTVWRVGSMTAGTSGERSTPPKQQVTSVTTPVAPMAPEGRNPLFPANKPSSS
jgi:hypothetical protein